MSGAIILNPRDTENLSVVDAPRDGLGVYVWVGLILLIGLVGGLVGWSVTAKLDGAVVVPGTFTVESSRKTVQHLEGGIISELLVGEGDLVRQGQVLLRLDSTIDRANLGVVEGQLDELLARRARLRAESRGIEAIAFPSLLLERRGDPAVEAILAGQEELFFVRRASRAGQAELVQQRIARFREEIAGVQAQRVSSKREIAFVDEELVGLRKLYKKGYATLSRVLSLEREAERIRGEVAGHNASIARARNGIEELKLELAQADRDLREEATAELRLTEPQIASLQERQVAAAQRLKRVEVTAPQDGVVVGLEVNTIGGVIRPGDAILDLVPADEDLVIEARIPTDDVDRIAQGQASRVRLTAFDQSTTPEVTGEVIAVSADSFTDEVSGTRYYNARIRLTDEENWSENGIELVPGMPAEIFIQTGSRTALSYFVKPLTDRLSRTFTDG
ncbi:HlyD family type I secretion periplasmic adaptor subunit [Pelagibius sp. Alg239-R121]|uniref:HlyD family type I secretion periplasmic adaptor subunit n=1 Tax=Pelagibius sp. Alg239-R121 TaxID=2993448 RepID=UPI0024A70D20|nr:HlyD family type I secretion periplasmic adaptor subunit [Pelagibius sp. Alg239-R121]